MWHRSGPGLRKRRLLGAKWQQDVHYQRSNSRCRGNLRQDRSIRRACGNFGIYRRERHPWFFGESKSPKNGRPDFTHVRACVSGLCHSAGKLARFRRQWFHDVHANCGMGQKHSISAFFGRLFFSHSTLLPIRTGKISIRATNIVFPGRQTQDSGHENIPRSGQIAGLSHCVV